MDDLDRMVDHRRNWFWRGRDHFADTALFDVGEFGFQHGVFGLKLGETLLSLISEKRSTGLISPSLIGGISIFYGPALVAVPFEAGAVLALIGKNTPSLVTLRTVLDAL